MKRNFPFRPIFPWLALLLALPASALSARDGATPVVASSNAARARQLADDVREMANAPGVSRAKREKHIATAVRTAVVAATAYRQGAEALGAATELVAAATRAAPAYAEIIIKAAALAPGVARIDGAAGAIRAAAQPGGRPANVSRAAPAPRRDPGMTGRETTAVAVEESVGSAMEEPEVTAARVHRDDSAEEASASRTRRISNPVDERNSAFTVKLRTGARYDDNVLLTSANRVHDVIFSVAPGAGFHWGDKSQSHGELAYSQSFEHYKDGTAPNVSLGNGTFQYAFDGARVNGSAQAGYQQLYQSNADLAANGQSAVIRTNQTSAGVSVEANPWAKIGLRGGANYSDTTYDFTGLLGNSRINVPVDVLFDVTPKTALTTGYVYGTQRPEGGGASSRDHYFNVGARGSFTPKLTGSFNVGYQLRQVGANPRDHMLAFGGNFAWELTPLTNLTLSGNRNFNASALGVTTRNTDVRLGATTSFSPRFTMGASLGWSDNEYGKAVFRPDQLQPLERTDRSWDASLNATYSFWSWFSASAVYFHRNVNSTIPSVESTHNTVSLDLELKY